MSEISRRGFLQVAGTAPLLATSVHAPAIAYEAVIAFCGTCGDQMLRLERMPFPPDDRDHPWKCYICGDKMLPYFRRLR